MPRAPFQEYARQIREWQNSGVAEVATVRDSNLKDKGLICSIGGAKTEHVVVNKMYIFIREASWIDLVTD
jgi:hypothetical protein